MRALVPRVSSRWMVALAIVLWVAAIGVGMKRILDYQETPGPPAVVLATWPSASSVPLSPERPTLLVFAHPRCSCTRATLSELARLMARTPGRLSAHLLLEVPRGMPIDQAQSDLLRAARAIPGLAVAVDSNAIESARFGVSTSGQVLVYDPKGHLLFAGGITPGRGHEGDSAGRDAIEDLAGGKPASPGATPVFGCGLESPVATVSGREVKR